MPFRPLDWLRVLFAIDRLLGLEERHAALIEAQAKEIQGLKEEIQRLREQIARLEAREEVLISEAKGAAAAAASAVASQHVASLARDVGAIDERTRRLGSDPER